MRFVSNRKNGILHDGASRAGYNAGLASIILVLSIFTGNCFLHPISGTGPSQELFGLSDESSNTELFAALLASLGGSAATHITLYNAGTTNGDMGGLNGANATCNASSNKPEGTTGVAFLSSSSQALFLLPGVPSDLPVQGPNGLPLATDWFDLFGYEQTILNTLGDAGVLPFPSNEFYSGTAPDGFPEPGYACDDWNSSDGQAFNAAVGIGDETSDFWISHTDPPGCNATLYLLCAAW